MGGSMGDWYGWQRLKTAALSLAAAEAAAAAQSELPLTHLVNKV